MNHFYNQEIDVLSYYFSPSVRNGLRCFPKQVSYDGKQLNFETGLRCLVQKGQDIVQIFNMTDGQAEYRLSFEPKLGAWKLLSMKSM